MFKKAFSILLVLTLVFGAFGSKSFVKAEASEGLEMDWDIEGYLGEFKRGEKIEFQVITKGVKAIRLSSFKEAVSSIDFEGEGEQYKHSDENSYYRTTELTLPDTDNRYVSKAILTIADDAPNNDMRYSIDLVFEAEDEDGDDVVFVKSIATFEIAEEPEVPEEPKEEEPEVPEEPKEEEPEVPEDPKEEKPKDEKPGTKDPKDDKLPKTGDAIPSATSLGGLALLALGVFLKRK